MEFVELIITIILAYAGIGFLSALFVIFVVREGLRVAVLAFLFWPLFWLVGIVTYLE